MAFFERVQGENFVIFSGNEVKENSENVEQNHGKGAIISARAPFQDRTLSMQNATKIQPQRTTKQSFGIENCGTNKYFDQENVPLAKVVKSEYQPGTFTIFEDVEAHQNTTNFAAPVSMKSDVDSHEEMEMHPSVTAMFKSDVDHPADISNYILDMTGDSVMSLSTPDEEMVDDESSQEDKIAEKKVLVRNEKHLWFPEYQHEIYQYLKEAEVQHGVRPDYMRKQTEITHNMRSILVDWMVEVAEEYKLERETLCLSILFVDRFLSVMAVARNKLQLVGAAAMFIASKYEEIYPPDVGEFVYITDNSYTKKQVLQMERLILRTLSFNIASPTVNCFCTNLLTNLAADEKTSALAMYLLELSMLDGEKFLKFMPSLIASSCVYLANLILEQTAFMGVFSGLAGYRVEDLSPCVFSLYEVFSSAPQLQQPAIREKYAKEKWHRVSDIQSSLTLDALSQQPDFLSSDLHNYRSL